jgi:hydrogenase/urease accessory protein HupE
LVLWLLLSTCLLSSTLYAHQNSRALGLLTLPTNGESGQEQRVATLSITVRYDDWNQAISLDSNNDDRITREELQPSAGFFSQTILENVRAFNDGQPCPGVVAAPDLGIRHGRPYVISVVQFECMQPLQKFTLSYGLFKTLHPGHRLLTRILAEGKELSHAFVTDPQRNAEYTLDVSGSSASLPGNLAEFVKLGLEHIITGYDHILFLIALVIMGGTLLELIKLATAFTLAHSITLAMAALQWVSLPSHIVEPVIALSIVLVAIENLVFHNRLARLRLTLALLFGLVHGFGFASALMTLDISRENIIVPLLGFNLGVEAGQLMFVALLYPLLRWLGDKAYKVQVVRLASVTILAIGMWWLVERTIMI